MSRASVTGRGSRRAGLAILGLLAAFVLAAPVVAPNDPERQFPDRAYAPPMRIRVWDGERVRSPFVYGLGLDDRLRRRYRTRTDAPVTVVWLRQGKLISTAAADEPLLLLGGDALGRDVFSRLMHGARLSLGVALAGVLGALVVGAALGAVAGASGGLVERLLMLAADFIVVLPGAYLVLVLRGVLPHALTTAEVFTLMTALFAFAAWPHAARGVRAIVAAERGRDYFEAARAAGAGRWRLAQHVLPAAYGFLTVQLSLLLPALLVAEATISYLGLGFPEPAASWGTMLQEAANVRVMAEAPWLLAPAASLFLIVLGVQLTSRLTPAAAIARLRAARSSRAG
jgi:peptide/nickel transport system permease protein